MDGVPLSYGAMGMGHWGMGRAVTLLNLGSKSTLQLGDSLERETIAQQLLSVSIGCKLIRYSLAGARNMCTARIAYLGKALPGKLLRNSYREFSLPKLWRYSLALGSAFPQLRGFFPQT